MTRDQLAVIAERWRALLLPEWRVVLVATSKDFDDADSQDYWAICRTKDDYTEIRLHLTDECIARSDEEVEITLVHEMLHALTRPWRQQIDSIAGTMSSEAYRALLNARGQAEEQLVDRLSRVLVSREGPRTSVER